MSATPAVAATSGELDALLAPARHEGQRVGLVPTMGALHEGHASLFRVARECVPHGQVVASIFVNPLQFGAGEDLDRYPRTFEADLKMCEREGVDVVFAPTLEEVYPGGEPLVTIEPGPLATTLEGEVRPGHFRGVLTVVAKLFGLARPDLAVFGEKDYQQLVLIRRMVADLCLGVEVVGAETVRDSDGLALSSRNRYLTEDQRGQAVALSRALRAAQRAGTAGVGAALEAARAELTRAPALEVDYLTVTDPELAPLREDAATLAEARILVAGRLGTTRLIDNMPLVIGTSATMGGQD